MDSILLRCFGLVQSSLNTEVCPGFHGVILEIVSGIDTFNDIFTLINQRIREAFYIYFSIKKEEKNAKILLKYGVRENLLLKHSKEPLQSSFDLFSKSFLLSFSHDYVIFSHN